MFQTFNQSDYPWPTQYLGGIGSCRVIETIFRLGRRLLISRCTVLPCYSTMEPMSSAFTALEDVKFKHDFLFVEDLGSPNYLYIYILYLFIFILYTYSPIEPKTWWLPRLPQ